MRVVLVKLATCWEGSWRPRRRRQASIFVQFCLWLHSTNKWLKSDLVPVFSSSSFISTCVYRFSFNKVCFSEFFPLEIRSRFSRDRSSLLAVLCFIKNSLPGSAVHWAISNKVVELIIEIRWGEAPGGRGVLLYMGYIGMCRCEGYGFQTVYSRIGYINQNVWV